MVFWELRRAMSGVLLLARRLVESVADRDREATAIIGGPPATGVVVGQHVAEEKLQLARNLRRQMTPAEEKLWAALRGRRLAGLRFRRQQVIDGFIVDFYCDGARLIVEVDGGIHAEQQGYDEARDEILAGRGFRIIRVANDDVVGRLPHVLGQIAARATATDFQR
jgi:very-short-patch-repair endonuclease